ncbi:MAG: hypothetical protein RMK31_02185 [Candidatus Caldarchaeum sp.]|nr:hypothetical protein [Candidatus Caldarchaeum sp.]
MRIAVDVDGVLADLAGMIIKIYHEETGVKLEREAITEWEFWHRLSMTRQQFMQMIVKAWSRWAEIQPIEDDMAEDVKKLHSFGEVDVLTQRPAETIDAVKKWLRHHGVPYRMFTWVPLKSSKANFVYDVYIDDSPRVAEQLQKTDRLLLVYDQPWNREVAQRKNIIRVRCLDEAVKLLEDGVWSV